MIYELLIPLPPEFRAAVVIDAKGNYIILKNAQLPGEHQNEATRHETTETKKEEAVAL